jgi:hypothetical protein
VLGQLPPRRVICSFAADPLPDPAADPEPAAEPAAVSEPVPAPDPVAVSEPEPVADPLAVPDPSVPPLSFLHAGPISKHSPRRAIAVRMRRMLPAFCRRGLAVAIVLQVALAHADKPDIKLPPGTRADASGQLVSTRGLRDTTDFIAKELDRRGIAVTKVGPIRVRGVELVRFLSQTPSTPWLAIHVLRSGGKTAIFFVARPPS